MRIVIDTSIWISAIATEGRINKCLNNICQDKDIVIILSTSILAEIDDNNFPQHNCPECLKYSFVYHCKENGKQIAYCYNCKRDYPNAKRCERCKEFF